MVARSARKLDELSISILSTACNSCWPIVTTLHIKNIAKIEKMVRNFIVYMYSTAILGFMVF